MEGTGSSMIARIRCLNKCSGSESGEQWGLNTRNGIIVVAVVNKRTAGEILQTGMMFNDLMDKE